MDREVLQQQFGLTGNSNSLKQVIDKIRLVAPTDITVLLQGESGVGKDVTARALHGLSNRKRNNLVIVNCGAIPEGIIESELFGHEKGSFTGAQASREGYFEKANHGTIFLDEIGDTPLNIQVKLLRVLESGEYFRVGSSTLQQTDVRVIAATNKDLWKEVEKGKFREDLFYRLDMVNIKLPPLRERKDDVMPLFLRFVQEFSSKYDSVFRGMSDEAKELLTAYRWPGNIRELRNVAEQLVVLEKSKYVDVDQLKVYLKGRQSLGATDHYPVLASKSSSSSDHTGYQNKEQSIPSGFNPTTTDPYLYKSLIEMKGDLGELRNMVARLMYASMPGNTPIVDAAHYLPSSASSRFNPFDNLSPDKEIAIQTEENDASDSDSSINVDDGKPDFHKFFSADELPSIVDAEQYLIEMALEKFDGNRRKASDALGISERTLYRKLDQYGLV